jgi:ligand-binding sensor protein
MEETRLVPSLESPWSKSVRFKICGRYVMMISRVYDTLASSLLTQQVEKTFFEATGLPVELVSSTEAVQFVSPQQEKHPFCLLMAQSRGSCAACQHVHEKLRRRLAGRLVPQTISCFAGLVEFAVPIVINGEHVATYKGDVCFGTNRPTSSSTC